MNTSYDQLSDGVRPVVESFPYRDTLGTQAQPNAHAAFSGDSDKKNNSRPESGEAISQKELARLVAEARAEGMAQAERQSSARFDAELAQERQRIAELTLEFQKQRAEYYSKVEVELVHLALAIAAKILHRESQVDRMVVAGLVRIMLERLQQNSNVIVRVRPEDAESWRYYFDGQSNLQVVADASLEPKACLLETELGTADMALDSQLKEVEQGFFDLLARKPEVK
jgi:flagellar assembly protein FliH